MFPNWQLITLSFFYISLLFLIAFIGDRYKNKLLERYQSVIYALTLGVYCTSWSFLGTTGQTSNNIISHLPIYLGPILLFVFAWPFIQRIIRVSLKLNLTSIADLLAARYGKSHKLAVLVTFVALVGTMPYIALQLKAIVYSFTQLQAEQNFNHWQLELAISLVLSGFTIVFGIRHIDVTERHPGIMLAIAFESLIKLFAFLSVGVFVTFFLFDSPTELWQKASVTINLEDQFSLPSIASVLAMLVITMAAFLSLPRQFQVMVVELKEEKNTYLSRKLFPLYLFIFALFAIPLGLAGQLLLSDRVPSDAYVLFLPSLKEQAWLTLLTFLGAISSASSMVIISAIALSTMLSNEIVFPHLYRAKRSSNVDYNSFRLRLLYTRRFLVFSVIMLGFCVSLMLPSETLSSLGEIAFGAFSQLTPALVAAFYWRHATLTGVYSGILVGFMLWLMFNFLPQLGLYIQPFSDGIIPATSMATLVSLSVNIFVLWSLSQVSRQSVQERVQASIFLEWRSPKVLPSDKYRNLDLGELELLVSRFVGDRKANQSFDEFKNITSRNEVNNNTYNQLLLEHTENTLASVMGASSARLVLYSALEGRDIALDELTVLVEEASTHRQIHSQNLLQSAIENASQGFSVIDVDLNIVAWNEQYIDLFDYPKELVYVGCPIEKVLRYNAKRGLFGSEDESTAVNKRLEYLRKGSPHSAERTYKSGQSIRIEGNPLPDGGFVMMFSDVTAYRKAEQVLKEANLDLEGIVQERTQKLEQVNNALTTARHKAEQAHIKKSQYLKACSHDLMQPLEAARLFTSALADQKNLNAMQVQQVDNIDRSLKVASDLLSDLGEISRIESGNIKPQISTFRVNELFDNLAQEFSASAIEAEVDFRVVSNSAWIKSDKRLLRRILQNLISNAFRYAFSGKVLLGARIVNNQVNIQVLDNGPGIPEDKQALVFEQFTQLGTTSRHINQGLGLGLNITQSLVQLLGHTLQLISKENQGCKFTLSVEQTDAGMVQTESSPVVNSGFKGVTVLCIDNDPTVLSGMVALLEAWHCNVLIADSYDSAQQVFTDEGESIQILLVDYQLNNNEDGLTLISLLRERCKYYLPAILITATTEADINEMSVKADVGFMRKVVKPAALRAMMSAKLAKNLQDNYLS